MAFPVAITTFNRSKYLYNTIDALERSDADLSKLTIIDDGSTEPEKGDVLCELSLRYNVIINEQNTGTYKACRQAITYMHDNYAAQHYVYMQDDVEVSRIWLNRGMMIMDDISKVCDKFAILSLYNRSEHDKGRYYYMENGHFGAVAWIVNRDFWSEYLRACPDEYGIGQIPKNDKRKAHFIKNLCDWKICRSALQMGWRIAYVGKSLVQHVGDRSSISGRDMTFCRTKNYVGIKG